MSIDAIAFLKTLAELGAAVAVSLVVVSTVARVAVAARNCSATWELKKMTNQECWDAGSLVRLLPVIFSNKACIDVMRATCGACGQDLDRDDFRGSLKKVWSVAWVSSFRCKTARIEAVSLCRACNTCARQSMTVNDKLKLTRHVHTRLDRVAYGFHRRDRDGLAVAAFEEI